MTNVHVVSGRASSSDSAPRTRISFRQPVAGTGYIDAAWWPRTLNLIAELPALMEVLWTAARDVNRVTYSLHTWQGAPRRMQIAGRTVRLGGFRTGDALMVSLSDGPREERIDVLVVAPDTAAAVAAQVFRIVSTAGNPLRVAEVLQQAELEVGRGVVTSDRVGQEMPATGGRNKQVVDVR